MQKISSTKGQTGYGMQSAPILENLLISTLIVQMKIACNNNFLYIFTKIWWRTFIGAPKGKVLWSTRSSQSTWSASPRINPHAFHENWRIFMKTTMFLSIFNGVTINQQSISYDIIDAWIARKNIKM